jgi:hypothetical protein
VTWTRLWDSGLVSTTANLWQQYSTGLTLAPGTLYLFAFTVAATGTTAPFRSPHAPLGTSQFGTFGGAVGESEITSGVPGIGFARYAQFAVTSGALPATVAQNSIAAAAYANGTTGSVPFAWVSAG